MSLYNIIYERKKECFKQKNKFECNLLGVVLSEATRQSDGKECDDEKIITCIRKMMNDLNTIIDGVADIINENPKSERFNLYTSCSLQYDILSKYLPKQLSENNIINIIKDNGFAKIKDCMEFFIKNHFGQYDGKHLAKIYQSVCVSL